MISVLSPSHVMAPWAQDVTVTVYGSNFTEGSVVLINGEAGLTT